MRKVHELIPENEDQKLRKNLKFSPALKKYSKIIQKMILKRVNFQKNTGYLFFRKPPLLQINTFSLGQKGVLIMGKLLLRVCLL